MTHGEGSDVGDESAIDIRGVARSFAGTTVLHDINLEVRDGEFFTRLGPSGSGKTTLLRMVAGFETQVEGAILDSRCYSPGPATPRGERGRHVGRRLDVRFHIDRGPTHRD
jgi:ABC-type sulfate/molybdate transport systems ATPase subunit